MEENKTLAIVSGAAGAVGEAFLDAFAANGYDCIGISRRLIESLYKIVIADLTDWDQTSAAIASLDLTDYERIIFVHTVGEFKFEADGVPEIDEDGDGIDDEVFHGNVDTFKHVVDVLIGKIRLNQQLVISNIGSISDQFQIPWFGSYGRSKDIVRAMMRKLANKESIRCVSLDVSTVLTDKERCLRPFADTAYWLTTCELTAWAVPYLLSHVPGYIEISLVKPIPDFDPVQYYLDPVAIRKRWITEMGL